MPEGPRDIYIYIYRDDRSEGGLGIARCEQGRYLHESTTTRIRKSIFIRGGCFSSKGEGTGGLKSDFVYKGQALYYMYEKEHEHLH